MTVQRASEDAEFGSVVRANSTEHANDDDDDANVGDEDDDECESAGEVFLPDVWQWFGHNPTDKDWTLRSYRLLGPPCSSVDDFWTVVNSVRPLMERSMLFAMRDGVMPMWDDPACVDGSLVSVLLPYDRAGPVFVDMCMRAMGETLVTDARALSDGGDATVVGVSTSPKRLHCVVKVWTSREVTEADLQGWAFPREVNRKDVRIEKSRKHISEARPTQ